MVAPHCGAMDRTTPDSPDDTQDELFMDQAPILIRLFDEWAHLTISSAALRSVRRWGLPGESVMSLDDALDRCGYSATIARLRHPSARCSTGQSAGAAAGPSVVSRIGRSDMAVTEDEFLLSLLRLAPGHMLAARIVLQRILPPLSAVARRHSNSKRQRLDLMDELIANAWQVICTYPTERRPARVVSNLVRDITFASIVRPARRRQSGEVPTTIEDFSDSAVVVAIEPLDELVELLRNAVDVAGMQPDDIHFICQLVNHGKPERLAAVLDVSPRTVRNHRDAIVHRLRTLVACAA